LKTILVSQILLGLILLLPFSARAAETGDLSPESFGATVNNLYVVSCTADFGGVGFPDFKETLTSPPTRAINVPRVTFQFGDYILSGSAEMLNAMGPGGYPVFEVSLFKGDPDNGQVNYVRIDGFTDIQVGQNRKMQSVSYLNVVYKGKSITRLDYQCSLARVR
jgi:hypothetical protein